LFPLPSDLKSDESIHLASTIKPKNRLSSVLILVWCSLFGAAGSSVPLVGHRGLAMLPSLLVTRLLH
jgi:hypothetical protein